MSPCYPVQIHRAAATRLTYPSSIGPLSSGSGSIDPRVERAERGGGVEDAGAAAAATGAAGKRRAPIRMSSSRTSAPSTAASGAGRAPPAARLPPPRTARRSWCRWRAGSRSSPSERTRSPGAHKRDMLAARCENAVGRPSAADGADRDDARDRRRASSCVVAAVVAARRDQDAAAVERVGHDVGMRLGRGGVESADRRCRSSC